MNIGNLTIEIATNVARLQADMDAAKRAVGGAMADVEKYVGYAKTALLGLGGAVTVGTFVNIVQGAIEAKARLYDLSLQTGVSVEALSGLGKVAKYSNTSLDDVAAASNKLSKALFTQNEDSKGAAQALKALGINFDEFKRQAPEQQFVTVAKAMSEFEDGTAKSAAAMLLYGKAGAQLLPFLKELEERGYAVGKQTTASALEAKKYEDNLITLKNAADAWKRQLAEAVLPTMVSITGAFVDARKEADNFNLAGAALKTGMETLAVLGANVAFVFKGVGRELGAWAAQGAALARGDLAGFTAIGDAVKADGERALAELKEYEAKVLGQRPRITTAGDFQRTDKDTSAAARKQLALDTAGSLADEQKAYDALIKSIKEKLATEQAEQDLQRKLTEGEKLQAKVFDDIDNGVIQLTLDEKLYVDGLLQRLLATEKLNKAQEAEAKWLEDSARATEQAIGQAAQRAAQMEDQARGMQVLLQEYGLTRTQLDALASTRDREAAAQIRARKVADDLNPALQDMNNALERQARALEEVATARDRLAARQKLDAESPMAGADRALRDYMDEVKRVGDATAGAVGNSLRGLEDTLTQFFRTGKLDAKSFIDTVISEFMRLAVVRPLMASILPGGGSFDSVLSLFGGGGNYSMNNGVGFSNAAGISGGRADGGPVSPFSTYLVGERGPELLTLGSRGGNVTPNHALGGITINSSPVFNVEARTDTGHVMTMIEASMQANNRALIDQLRATGRIS